MPSSRLAAGVTLLAVTAALPLAVTVAAHAAGPASALVYLSDGDNRDGLVGIVAAPSTDPSHTHPVLATKSMADVLAAKLSPDGQHVAALVDSTAGSQNDNGNYDLQVMNLDGSGRRTLATETNSDTGVTAFDGFTWLDSHNIVVGYFHSDFDFTTFSQTTVRDLRAIPAAGGTLTKLVGSDGLSDPAASPDGLTIAATYLDPNAPRGEAGLRMYDVGQQSISATSLDIGYLGQPAWSHDGTHVAYVKDVSTNAQFRSEIDTVSLSAGTWSTPQPLIPAADAIFNEDPSWSPDDASVWYDRADTAASAPAGEIWTVAADGTQQARALTSSADVAMPTLGPVDATAPAVPTLTPFTLGGTTTTVAWTRPADGDYLYAIVTRDRGTVDEQTFVTSGTSYVDTTTVIGQTYGYDVTAVDAAGNKSAPSAVRQVTALAPPRMVVSTPTSATRTGLAFPVAFGVVADPAGTTYDLQQGVAGATPGAPVATTARSAAVTGVAGRTYVFRARTVDAYGNASGYTPWASATVPYDQTSGAFSRGWSTAHSSSYWLGSEAVTGTNGATVTFTVISKSAQVIGDRLPGGASFKVYVGSTYKGTVATVASTTRHRQVLWSASLGSLAKRTIKLVAVVKTGHSLRVDGLAAAR